MTSEEKTSGEYSGYVEQITVEPKFAKVKIIVIEKTYTQESISQSTGSREEAA